MNQENLEPRFLISIIAQMLNVHPQTLRAYERIGLITPSRSDGNTRLYSERDIEIIKRILVLTRDLGVNLAGVEVIIKLRQQLDTLQKNIKDFLQQLLLRIEDENCDPYDFIENFFKNHPDLFTSDESV